MSSNQYKYNRGGNSYQPRPPRGGGYRGSDSRPGRPPCTSGAYSHKPKLEEDYRTKNIHKFKRLQGSNVMSPRTERMLA